MEACGSQPFLKQLKDTSGFTLVEMMVAVGIASIIAGIAVPQYEFAMGKARDAKRVSDMQTIRMAFEGYFVIEGKYPDHNSRFPVPAGGSYIGRGENIDQNLEPYIDASMVPRDPLDDGNSNVHFYSYDARHRLGGTDLVVDGIGAVLAFNKAEAGIQLSKHTYVGDDMNMNNADFNTRVQPRYDYGNNPTMTGHCYFGVWNQTLYQCVGREPPNSTN